MQSIIKVKMQNLLKYQTLVLVILLTTSCLVAFKPTQKSKNNKTQSFNIVVYYDTTAFAKAKDTILHLPKNQLQWTDFKAPPVMTEQSVAKSSVGFKYDADIAQSDEAITIRVSVSAFFIKTKSWKKPADANNYILQHEQRHFDLARYGAQLFASAIATKKMNLNNFDKTLQNTYSEAWQQYVKLQQQYDQDSNHSINEPQQLMWNTNIDNYLKLCR